MYVCMCCMPWPGTCMYVMAWNMYVYVGHSLEHVCIPWPGTCMYTMAWNMYVYHGLEHVCRP